MKTYQQPFIEFFYLESEDVLTVSPASGDNDKSDFDEWGNLT